VHGDPHVDAQIRGAILAAEAQATSAIPHTRNDAGARGGCQVFAMQTPRRDRFFGHHPAQGNPPRWQQTP